MTTPTTYKASLTKRRTKEDIRGLKATMIDVLKEYRPMTVRQLFYRMVSMGAIDKTENQYNNTVIRLLSQMRREKIIPFSWIADSTRWMRKPDSFSSLEEALHQTAQTYRRALWDNQDAYVEIWLEKDALAGVIYEETEQWDVPLMVTRGYPSLSFLASAAEAIAGCGKPVFLYYLGDHDPSGVDIPRKVERDLRAFAPGADIYFRTVAVTPGQIEEWGLPTRPTKKTDSRSKNFKGESVEVDAIGPAILRELVRDCISDHVDTDALNVLEVAEESERSILQQLAARQWTDIDGEAGVVS